MNITLSKIKKSRFINEVKSILSSRYFPFITAIFSLICYYLGWDIVFIYYVGITGLAILLLLDDFTPMITLLLFMCVLVSYENSPSNIMTGSDYYFRPEILAQIFIVIGALCIAIVYRVVLNIIKKKFTLSPVFFGLCAFAVVLLLNGLFSKDYNPKNLVYGLVMALCFLGIFTALKDNLSLNEDSFIRISLSFFALSIVLITELATAYLNIDELTFNREKLTFGWGMWNTMGMMLLICIPPTVYLATKHKYGFIFTTYSVILCAATWLSCSRQAMLASAIIYPICIIILLIKGPNRWANIIVVLAALLALSIGVMIFHDTVFKYFKDMLSMLFSGKISGNGRVTLWKAGIENFKQAPFLGVGFYIDLYSKLNNFQGYSGMSFIPQMCHNTIIELLSACGIMGLAAYCVHTVQLFISYMKNINLNRAFILLSIISLAGISLADNHIFNIFPTIIYSLLAAALVSSEKKNAKQTEKLPLK